MPTGLFWNINKMPLAEHLRKLCDTYDIDLLMPAESALPDNELFPGLNEGRRRIVLRNPDDPSPRISFFVRLWQPRLKIVSDKPHCSTRAISPPGSAELNMHPLSLNQASPAAFLTTYRSPSRSGINEADHVPRRDAFYITLLIIAPSLDNYNYEVLSVIHDIPFYPATIRAEEGEVQ